MNTNLENYLSELNKLQGTNPCEKCPNNPKNNPAASGICNCAAPYFANPIR